MKLLFAGLIAALALGCSNPPPDPVIWPTLAPEPTRPYQSAINVTQLNQEYRARQIRQEEHAEKALPYSVPLPGWVKANYPLVKEIWVGEGPHEHRGEGGPFRRPHTQPGAYIPTAAHAHMGAGVICVNPDHFVKVWDPNRPTQTFLHEYAHLLDTRPRFPGMDVHDEVFDNILWRLTQDARTQR